MGSAVASTEVEVESGIDDPFWASTSVSRRLSLSLATAYLSAHAPWPGGGRITSRPLGRGGESSTSTLIRPQPTQSIPEEITRLLSLLPPGTLLVRPTAAGEAILAGAEAGGLIAVYGSTSRTERPIEPPAFAFRDYCLDRYLPGVRRPNKGNRPLSPGTFAHQERIAAQLRAAGVQTDPPDWAAFGQFIRSHPKTAAACENHRRTLVWKSAYWGVPIPDEPWARKRLDNREDVAVARRAGKMRARARFLRLPDDVLALVSPKRSAYPDALNAATFRAIAYTSLYVGPRTAEPRDWRLADYDERLGVLRCWQEKKSDVREVQPPEPYALGSLLDPSLSWYLKYIRPKADPQDRFSSPDSPIFLFRPHGASEGRPWPTSRAYAQFMERGMDAILGAGPQNPGPHSLRRACATLRRFFGWSVDQVADFIGDTPEATRNSYIDRAWLNRVGTHPVPAGVTRPLLPRLRGNQTFGLPPLGHGVRAALRRRKEATRKQRMKVIRTGPEPVQNLHQTPSDCEGEKSGRWGSQSPAPLNSWGFGSQSGGKPPRVLDSPSPGGLRAAPAPQRQLWLCWPAALPRGLAAAA